MLLVLLGYSYDKVLLNQNGKLYLCVHIQSCFRHACLQAQPLVWPVTLSMAGITTQSYNATFIMLVFWSALSVYSDK